MTRGEYRCPNCLERDLPGLRFGVELVGVPYFLDALWIDLNGLNYRLFCLKCLKDGVPGLDGEIGLVAEQLPTGWRVLTHGNSGGGARASTAGTQD